MSNHDEDDVENIQDKKSKQWGAQDMNKASSKMADDTQDENEDLKGANMSGLGIKEEKVGYIKIKRDDTQFLVDNLHYKKEAAEALLYENGGDLKKAVFSDLGLDSLPEQTISKC